MRDAVPDAPAARRARRRRARENLGRAAARRARADPARTAFALAQAMGVPNVVAGGFRRSCG